MQNTNDRMDKTVEIPSVKAENTEAQKAVDNDTVSFFDGTEEAFSESMVVEKADVEVDSSENAAKEMDARQLEGSAKDYFKANHSESIEDKVSALSAFADDTFGEEKTDISEIFDDGKKKKKKEKKKKKNRISDDDMDMLMGISHDEFEGLDDKNTLSGVENEDGSVEYSNPLGSDKKETDEERLMKYLGVKDKQLSTYEDAFGNEDEPDNEYTEREQEPLILASLRKKAIFSTFSVVITLILVAVCAYFEFVAGSTMPHPEFLEVGKYGVTFAMTMLQLMFVGVMVNLSGVKRAFMGLRPGKASAEGFCAAALLVVTAHSVLSCVFAGGSSELVSYCTVGLISLLVLSINSFIKAYTTLSSFCIAASKHPKFSGKDLDEECLEARRFERYLDDETTVFTVGRADFVKGFFKKQYRTPSATRGTFKFVLVSLIVAVVVGVVRSMFGSSYDGVCAFSAVALVSLPANALLSTALPFFFASAKAKKTQTAFIGEAAPDTYEKTGVVSFDDTEVFPARLVKVSSIRTYGEHRIDKVILYMARIFDKVGGPLSYVFANSIQNIDEFKIEVNVTEHFADGMSARIDGHEVLVGNGSFMKLYDLETPFDNIDESFTHSLGSIMYMAVDGAVAAKFYIKYTMNRGFEAMLHAFYDAGICVGVKTVDPCITDELINSNLKGTNYPVSVIKTYARGDSALEVAPATEGSIISLSGVHNFLLGFIRLDNLRNVYRTNTYVSIISIVVGLLLSSFMAITGTSAIGMGFIMIFQLLWCIPTFLLSLISK